MSLDQQVSELRGAIAEAGAVTFYRRDALGRWDAAIQVLEREGFALRELIELDEQSSCVTVRRVDGGNQRKGEV